VQGFAGMQLFCALLAMVLQIIVIIFGNGELMF